jgi:hypothetical protein
MSCHLLYGFGLLKWMAVDAGIHLIVPYNGRF